MSAARSNLIRLLRLLDDDLPAADAARLREQLASDVDLAGQYRRLVDLKRTVTLGDALLPYGDEVDPSDVAEFVEGRMENERQAKFERLCWHSEGLLREVLAAWNSLRDADLLEPVPEPDERALSLVRELLRTGVSSPDRSDTPGRPVARDAKREGVATHPLPQARPTGQVRPQGQARPQGQVRPGNMDQGRPVDPDPHGPPGMRAAFESESNGERIAVRPRRSAGRRRSRWVTETWGVVACVVVALLAVAIQILSQATPHRTAGSPDDDLPAERRQQDAPVRQHGDGKPNRDVSDPSARPDQNRSPDHSPSGALAQEEKAPSLNGTSPPSRPRRPVAEEPLVQTDGPSPRRPAGPRRPGPGTGTGPGNASPDASPSPSREPRTVPLVAWSEIQGVAGDKSDQEAVWGGIQSRSPAELWNSNVRSQLLTLPHSRVSGVLVGLPSEPRIIADADSLIEIAAGTREPGADTGTNASNSATTHLVAVQRGRLAIDGLQSGQAIQLEVETRMFTVEATSNNSTLAIERSDGEIVVAAYRGKVRTGDQEFTPQRWGRVDSAGHLTAFRPQRPTHWYRAQRKDAGLPAELCETFNAAPDLVGMAVQLESSPDPATGVLAAQVALRCLVAANRPISIGLARRLTASSQEGHRRALIEWVMSRYRQDAMTGEADLKVICRMLQAPPATANAMSGWFQAAVGGRPPTTTQLSELVANLRDTSPVFTRHCAKYFLQHILGDPLVEYDPSVPTQRPVMASVTRKVRAWQQANP